MMVLAVVVDAAMGVPMLPMLLLSQVRVGLIQPLGRSGCASRAEPMASAA